MKKVILILSTLLISIASIAQARTLFDSIVNNPFIIKTNVYPLSSGFGAEGFINSKQSIDVGFNLNHSTGIVSYPILSSVNQTNVQWYNNTQFVTSGKSFTVGFNQYLFKKKETKGSGFHVGGNLSFFNNASSWQLDTLGVSNSNYGFGTGVEVGYQFLLFKRLSLGVVSGVNYNIFQNNHNYTYPALSNTSINTHSTSIQTDVSLYTNFTIGFKF